VYNGLPGPERQTAVLLAGNYGEAGALDHYGPTNGLPPVYSGHNSYWSWGPPTAERTVVGRVGDEVDELAADAHGDKRPGAGPILLEHLDRQPEHVAIERDRGVEVTDPQHEVIKPGDA